MRTFIFLFILVSCAHQSKKTEPKYYSDQVSVRVALDQAQMSFLRGCVESFRTFKIKPSFETCREKAIQHRLEVQEILETEPITQE